MYSKNTLSSFVSMTEITAVGERIGTVNYFTYLDNITGFQM